MKKIGSDSTEDVSSICWCMAPPDLTSWWEAGEGTRLAIWPSPVLEDQCFAAAGFTEFAEWRSQQRKTTIEKMTSALLTELSRLGEPGLRIKYVPGSASDGVFRWLPELIRGTPPTPTLDDIIWPLEDDAFPPCDIGFGHPPAAMLRTADGHEMWWIYLASNVAESARKLTEALAAGRPIRQVDIDLTRLAHEPWHSV